MNNQKFRDLSLLGLEQDLFQKWLSFVLIRKDFQLQLCTIANTTLLNVVFGISLKQPPSQIPPRYRHPKKGKRDLSELSIDTRTSNRASLIKTQPRITTTVLRCI